MAKVTQVYYTRITLIENVKKGTKTNLVSLVKGKTVADSTSAKVTEVSSAESDCMSQNDEGPKDKTSSRIKKL